MTHHMTGPEYTAALSTLNLTPEQAATWLGIGRSTAYRYLKTGCEGPVVVAIRMAVAVMTLERVDVEECGPAGRGWLEARPDPTGEYVRHSDLTAAVGVEL